jgi:2-isopropylmalate synthase
MARRIAILDTTLRDGGRAPGFGMGLDEKLEVARQLARLGVDVIEAGRPSAGPDERSAVKEIARLVREPVIASAARASDAEIDAAWEAVRGAERPRLHVILGSSPERIARELGTAGPEGALELAAAAVRRALSLCPEVEFSAADATRADPGFLRALLAAAIEAGASVVNVADTVGRALPAEFAALVRDILGGTPGIGRATLSVHCHDDLGLATANTLAAIEAGAQQVECAINGLGDRAGNAALEEVVMALATRADYLDAASGVDTTRLYGSSRLVQAVTGMRAQPNKAVVGDYALSRAAGRGSRDGRESGAAKGAGAAAALGIVTPEAVGRVPEGDDRGRAALGRRSGRRAFDERLALLGYRPRAEAADRLYEEFKELAERKRAVSDRDIEALALGEAARAPETYRLDRFVVNSGTGIAATSAVRLALRGGETVERVAAGDGPIDAAFKAVDKIVGARPVLELFAIDAVTEGRDAQGEARVRIRSGDRRFNGRGLSTDVVEASVLAYLAAMNAMAGGMEVSDGKDSDT